jgi:ABC-2 type transport system permease protein
MQAASAFLRRDFRVFTSYRFAVATNVLGIVVIASVFVLVGKALGRVSSVAGEGTSYTSFVLVGLAFTDPLTVGMTALPRAIREGQLSGTLEPILLAPVRWWRLVPAMSAFTVLQSWLRCAIFLGLGLVVLGFWRDADVVAAVLVFVPAALTFVALGLVTAALVMAYKHGDPVMYGYAAASALLGGTLFPVALLPAWLQAISRLLPMSYALDGMRATLAGGGVASVGLEIAVLTAFACLTLPLGLVAFRRALDRARKDGSLVHY